MMERLRVDKWLWAARFFKTRSLSTDAIGTGRVRVNGEGIKPAKELKIGDWVEVSIGRVSYTLVVSALSDKRGSASIAQTLYQETPESRLAREQAQEQRKRFAEPAEQIFARPTKKDRRSLDRLREA
jgi:ribosome-associated heat shock protein Hsp15